MLCDRETTEKVSILIPIFNLSLMENTFCSLWPPPGSLSWLGRGDGSRQLSPLKYYPSQAPVGPVKENRTHAEQKTRFPWTQSSARPVV